MSTKVMHVDATFNGKDVRFRLRDRAGIDGETRDQRFRRLAPFALFQAFASGTWTIEDLVTVLDVAGPGFEFGREVRSFFETHPPGPYALLGMKITQALLFGLDPDDAKFDEPVP